MMAGRRKGPPTPPDGEGAFAVVVQELRGEFKVFGGALSGLRGEMTELRGEMTELRQQVTGGFERVEHELGEVKRDLAEVKVDLAEVKVDLGLVKSAATTHSRELKEMRSALGNKVERGEVEAIVEHVVARIAGQR
jgi:ribosomal protein L29